MSTREQPIDRPSARVILLDPRGRVLLLASRLPDGETPGRLWVAPGGALEPGETWEQAARREAVLACRWWTVDELSVTNDVIAPRKLAHLLPPLLSGQIPATPILLDA